MFSKAFLLCALVLAVTASDKIKKDVDDTTYDTTAYDSQTGSGPIWEKFRPTIGFTRDESGLQKTLSVPYNPFFQGIKVNVKPFTGGYVQIKANGAEIYKPLTSTATADPADTQEAEIIVDAQPDDEYYGNSLYRRSLYGDDIYTPYRVPVPAKYWRFPYYYPQVYQGQEYYPQNQYQNEYIYPEGDYQNYDRVVRSSTVTEGKKDKKTTTKDEKKDTQEEQINKFLYAYPRLSGLYSSIYRVPLYNGVQQQVGPVYGQDYNGVARQYYGGLYGRTQYPVSQKNYYDAINTPAYRQYQGNYFGEQYPYYRTAGQGYDVYNYLRQQPVY